MYDRLVRRMLDRLITDGALAVTWPDGTASRHGTGGASVAVTLTDPTLPRRLTLNPELALGEGYADGGLTIEGDDLHGLLDLVATNARSARIGTLQHGLNRARTALRWFRQRNPLPKARRNVEAHYDLPPRLYDLFLDDDLQYTCGYFPDPDMTLEAAQEAKKALIARKLCLEPGMRVLDIGCGWGGLSLTLARDHGARVTGISLSNVQLDYARARARAQDLDIDFRYLDYRHVTERFDRIVVVGMLEHVGPPQYPAFFDTLARNLAPDGVALVHTIGRAGPPGVTSSWLDRYIFPGGYAPAMTEVLKPVQNARLTVTDIETWRDHYPRTLRHWQARFAANEAEIRALHDDRFIRMWRYYLVLSEISFTRLGMAVHQYQLAHHNRAVPVTRDYLRIGG